MTLSTQALRSTLVSTMLATLTLTITPALAGAQGNPVGGSGTMYYLNDEFTGKANIELNYGEPNDVIYFGDWDGNGTDTPMVRRGNQFHVRNTNTSGRADNTFHYGDPGDTVLVGDWNGDGKDTLAVRRGNVFHIKNTTTTGVADKVIAYGDPGDTVLVGDWNGDQIDTITVRRGNRYYIKNSISSGVADQVIAYGDPGDTVLVGDWNGDQIDTLAVRRGNNYYIKNSLGTGTHDLLLAYGNPTDTAFAGDWNGDGRDTLGVRRPADPPRTGFGEGWHIVNRTALPGTYRSEPNRWECLWARTTGLTGDDEEIIAADYGVSPYIVTIKASDAAFFSDSCGNWTPVEQTYPATPATSIPEIGVFVVNRHIASGRYVAAGGDGCYWERMRGFSGEPQDTIENQHGFTNVSVTISSSDAGFYTSGCGTWRRVSA